MLDVIMDSQIYEGDPSVRMFHAVKRILNAKHLLEQRPRFCIAPLANQATSEPGKHVRGSIVLQPMFLNHNL